MFELGGNAVDAAVCTALVAGVIEPVETTLAGSGFMLLSHPDHGTISVEFGPLAPMGAAEDMFDIDTSGDPSNVLGLARVINNANVSGPRASGVPRTLFALLEAQARWGKLTRGEVMEAAITAAREGFPADPWFVVNAMQDLEILRKDPGCAETFLDADGFPMGRRSASAYGVSVDLPPLVAQPLLASTLETIAKHGHGDLIDGITAGQLAETFAEYGMVLSPADLKQMPPRIETPRMLQYRDRTVAVPRGPGGGLSVLQMLNVWQHLVPNPGALTREESVVLTSRVLRRSFADRYHWLGDESVRDVPVDELLSDEYAAHLAQLCDVPWAIDAEGEAPWTRFASEALHDPWAFGSAGLAPRWSGGGATEPTSGTTHVSAAGADGWVVAITHTAANHFGSGILCPRTGLLFDSAMAWFNAVPGSANSIAPGARPVANMGPALILGGGAHADYAVGASGGRRILSAVMQVIREIVEIGPGSTAALAAPRIDASGGRVVLGLPDAGLARRFPELQALVVPGHPAPFALDFARVNTAARDLDGLVETAIEARAYGA